MTSKKTRNLIICLIIVAVVSLSLCFNTYLTNWIYSSLDTKFNIISSKDNLRVHYVSVGNGDAIAINLPDGKTMLIDTGTSNYASHYTNYIERKVLPYDSDNIIDWLILTHPDADHIGGTAALLENVKVDVVYMPTLTSTSRTYETTALAVQASSSSDKITEDFSITNGDYVINIYAPVSTESTNNSCPVIRLEYKEKVFLFVGDIEAEAEQEFMSRYYNELDCDVLKVGHHGSNSSTSNEFLQCTTPEISIISAGKNNRYCHPTADTLTKLDAYDSQIFRTDESGDLVAVLGGHYNFEVKTGDVTIINMMFDYWIIVVVVDAILLIKMTIVLIRKESSYRIKGTKISKIKK